MHYGWRLAQRAQIYDDFNATINNVYYCSMAVQLRDYYLILVQPNGRSKCAGARSLVRSLSPSVQHLLGVGMNRTAIKQLYRCRQAVADLVLDSRLAHISSAAHIR